MEVLLDRKKAPKITEIPSISILDVKKETLNNGLNVLSLKQESFNTLKFEISIPKRYDVSTNYALGYLTTRMLQEGTESLTSEEISDKIAMNGAFFEVNYSNDSISLQLYCLQPFFKELLHLVYDILYRPSFPNAEFENLKSRYIQQFLTNIEKTSYLASIYSKQTLFGEGHPYTVNTAISDIETIQLEMVKEYYQKAILEAKPVFYLTGEFGENEVNYIKDVFKQINFKEDQYSLATQELNQFGERHIHKDNAVQNTIAITAKSILKSHQDYHKLVVTNEILGGFFGSRLMKNIREDKGYTYGIYSRVIALKYDAYFYIGTDLKPAFVAPCLEEIKKEIHILRNEKVSSSELDVLKNYLLGRFSSSLSSVYDHMKKRKTIHHLHLKDTFFSEYLDTIKKIDSSDIMDIAQKYLDVDKFSILNVGAA